MRAKLSHIFGFIVFGLLLVALSPSVAFAQDRYSTEATLGDGVEGNDPDRGTTINARVWAIEDVGDVQLVGGSFLDVRDRSSFATIPRPYLAAFDENTGEYVPELRTQPNGTVYDIKAHGDQVILAGEFTSVNSVPGTEGIAIIDPETGEVDTSFSFDLSNGGQIRSVAVRGNHLYLGGAFAWIQVGGVSAPLDGLARVNLVTKQLDLGFQPSVEGAGRVWGIDTASNGRIFVGGYFDSINGVDGTETFAALNPNGSVVAGWNHGFPFAEYRFTPSWSHNGGAVNDLVVLGDKVFTAGAKHFWTAHSISDGAELAAKEISNDGQSVEVVNGQIVVGCHCTSTISDEFPGVTDRYSRVIDPIALTEVESPTVNTEGGAGGWASSGDSNGCLWTGGQLSSTVVGGVQQPGWNLLRFCANGFTPPSSSRLVPTFDDQVAPVAPSGLTVTQRGSTVDLTWTSNESQVGYLILRNGVVVGRTSGEAYSDRFLSPGIHYWQVAAFDLAGNVSTSSAHSTAVNIAAPVNIAQNATATQISDSLASTGADRAIDGNTSPLFNDGSVARTLGGEAWFNLDLGAVYDIDNVQLYPSEFFGEINNRIRLYHSDEAPIDALNRVEAAEAGLSVWTGPRIEEDPRVENAELAVSARYIRLLRVGRISLAEIEVYTTPVRPTPAPRAVDSVDPTAPVWKSVRDLSDGTLLRWGGDSDNRGVVYYEIYRNDELVGRTVDSELLVAGDALASEFTVVAFDAEGNDSGGIPEPIVVDLQACSAVRDGISVDVSWDASGDSISAFVIRRSVDGSVAHWRGVADAADDSFTDSDRDGELGYVVQVRATNGEIEAEVECETTTENVVEPVPVEVSACSYSRDGQNVDVSWVSDGEVNRFVVLRTVDGGPNYWRGVADGNASTFTDSDRDGVLVYSVEAKNAAGAVLSSVECDEGNDGGDPIDPNLPVIVHACAAVRDGVTVNVSWDADGAPDRFVIRRSVEGGTNHWRGVAGSTDDSFVDSDRNVGLVYSVEARDVAGNVLSFVECGDDVAGDAVPEGLTTTFIDRSRFVVHWTSPGTVEIEVDGQVVASDNDGFRTVSGLDAGTEYTVRVRFVGSNTWSAPITVATNP